MGLRAVACQVGQSGLAEASTSQGHAHLQDQLRQFNGASAISSADYFGDDNGGAGGRGGGGGGGGGAGGADEFMSRLSIQMQQEMRQVTSIASEASKKVGNMLANFNRY